MEWKTSDVSKFVLANNGFFYKHGDMVQCFQCGVRIRAWKSTDIVPVEHFIHSPTCVAAKRKLLDVGYLVEALALVTESLTDLKKELAKKEEEERRFHPLKAFSWDVCDHE